MLSPLPTQQPPAPEPEQKKTSTPIRPRPGQTPYARAVKGIFRYPIKGLYYVLQFIRTHKLVTFIALILLIASYVVTTYAVTQQWPFGVGNDQFNFHIHGGDGGGEHVKNWLYAIRDGDVATIALINSETIMSQPPDPTQLVAQFSQQKTNLSWKEIHVVGIYSQADGTVDSYVTVVLSANGPGGPVKGVVGFHFVTAPAAQGRILLIDVVALRPAF